MTEVPTVNTNGGISSPLQVDLFADGSYTTAQKEEDEGYAALGSAVSSGVKYLICCCFVFISSSKLQVGFEKFTTNAKNLMSTTTHSIVENTKTMQTKIQEQNIMESTATKASAAGKVMKTKTIEATHVIQQQSEKVVIIMLFLIL